MSQTKIMIPLDSQLIFMKNISDYLTQLKKNNKIRISMTLIPEQTTQQILAQVKSQ